MRLLDEINSLIIIQELNNAHIVKRDKCEAGTWIRSHNTAVINNHATRCRSQREDGFSTAL